MVVDGEHDGASLTRRRAEPHRGSTAVGADFEQRETRARTGGANGGRMQRVALVNGYEPERSYRDAAHRRVGREVESHTSSIGSDRSGAAR